MRTIILFFGFIFISCFGIHDRLDFNNPDYHFAIADHITMHHLKLAISREDNIPLDVITIIPATQTNYVLIDDTTPVNTLRAQYQTDYFYVPLNNNTPPLLLLVTDDQN